MLQLRGPVAGVEQVHGRGRVSAWQGIRSTTRSSQGPLGGGGEHPAQFFTIYNSSSISARVQVHSVLFPNYEGLPEHDRVADPPREVTLFKTAVHFVDEAAMMSHYGEMAHGLPNYFAAYSSGKSVARVLPGLRSHGAHHWQSYNGTHTQHTHTASGLLHYTYNRCGAAVAWVTPRSSPTPCTCMHMHMPLQRMAATARQAVPAGCRTC